MEHAAATKSVKLGPPGYTYRVLEGLIVPEYTTPYSYYLSRTLETRAGDICFVSFPRSGSTWLSYILLLIVGDGEEPVGTLWRNTPWVASAWPYRWSRAVLDRLPAPRLFRSHMPYHMALGGEPRKCPCKYVYIARNPKDVAVSYYHFERGKEWAGGYLGSWSDWLEMFVDGRVQRGDWFDHVLGWWSNRDAENIHFLKYEHLKKDIGATIDGLAEFLERPLDPATRRRIVEKVTFRNMRRNRFTDLHDVPGYENFYRNGTSRSWRQQFTPEQAERFDRLYETRMAGSGLTFQDG